MERIYRYPKQIVLCLVLLTLLGLVLGARLPVALYPDSSQPQYNVEVPLLSWTARDFLAQYGESVGATLHQIPDVESVITQATLKSVRFRIKFKWGVHADEIKRSVETAVSQVRSQIPVELQRYLMFYQYRQNSGFFAASIYYRTPKLTTLYDEVGPQLVARINSITGVGSVDIDNPDFKRLFVTIDPEKLAAHRLSAIEVSNYLQTNLSSVDAGSMKMEGSEYRIILQNRVGGFEDLAELSLQPLGRPGLKLKDIAKVELADNATGSSILRFDGKRSLIVWVSPDSSGNIKAISDQVVELLEEIKRNSHDEIGYQLLVNPAEFIRAAILDVEMNTLIGGGLAVLILMLFVGSLQLTIYSAIEIPLALIWAFILMWLFGVSINLISLGGLALTAGMNIDASVVMIENIVRHMRRNPYTDAAARTRSVMAAVGEVFWPIMTSTLITMIVFAPLSMTSGITYALLGDLAKAVVYSHGFSAIVALLIVPTVRLYWASDNTEVHPKLMFFQQRLERFEEFFAHHLKRLLHSPKARKLLLITSLASVVVSVAGLYPFIRQELIAVPKTDFVWVSINSEKFANTEELGMELAHFEEKLISEGKPQIEHVFTMIWNENGGGFVVRLRRKSDLDVAMTKIRQILTNKPDLRFMPFPWNPSEMRLPTVYDFKVKIAGPETERIAAAQNVFQTVDRHPQFDPPETNLISGQQLSLVPKFNYLENIQKLGGPSFADLGQLVTMVLHGTRLGNVRTPQGPRAIEMRFPRQTAATREDLASLPVVAGPYVLSLQSLFDIKQERYNLSLYQERGRDLAYVQAMIKDEFKPHATQAGRELEDSVRALSLPENVQLEFVDSKQEMRDSLKGLLVALLMSLVLIASVLYMQFGRLLDVTTVMMAIPLGLLGSSLSLFVMRSTWSINSILGVIMLGGICVNNSILLVTFFNQKLDEGVSLIDAALESAVVRLRPILITSLTTILATVPIAVGWGEGAEVLQPLGIAVCGGMLFSTLLTLFLIPTLEVSFARSR